MPDFILSHPPHVFSSKDKEWMGVGGEEEEEEFVGDTTWESRPSVTQMKRGGGIFKNELD